MKPPEIKGITPSSAGKQYNGILAGFGTVDPVVAGSSPVALAEQE
jgi:hypothetical protein